MQRSTSSGSYPGDLKGTARTPTQASGTGFPDSNATTTTTHFSLPRDQTPKAQGSSGQCLPKTCSGVDPKTDQEPPSKYKEDEQVYDPNDLDTDGQPTERRLWICCMIYDSKEQMWKYRVKDENGETVDWFWEDELENF